MIDHLQYDESYEIVLDLSATPTTIVDVRVLTPHNHVRKIGDSIATFWLSSVAKG
jgi:hypothetical protein